MKYSLVLLCLLAILIVLLFFWASSPQHSSDEYRILYETQQNEKIVPDSVFTIMTYNIGYLSGMLNNTSKDRPKRIFEQNLKIAKSIIRKEKVDIATLQEVDFHSARSHFVDQEKALSDGFFRYVARAVNWDKTYLPYPYFPISKQFGEIYSGQSILSKFPIESHQRYVLERPNHPFYYDSFYIDRLAQIATVNIHDTKVKIINVHLEAFKVETRKKQIKFVLSLAKNYANDFPVILIGDFNSDPNRKESGLNLILDAKEFAIAKDAPFYITYPSQQSSEIPKEAIDHIFYTPKTIESSLEVKLMSDMGTVSDHLPVLMRFRLKKEK